MTARCATPAAARWRGSHRQARCPSSAGTEILAHRTQRRSGRAGDETSGESQRSTYFGAAVVELDDLCLQCRRCRTKGREAPAHRVLASGVLVFDEPTLESLLGPGVRVGPRLVRCPHA